MWVNLTECEKDKADTKEHILFDSIFIQVKNWGIGSSLVELSD